MHKKIQLSSSLGNLFDIRNIGRITFRDDITGLRAIAVLAVILYHADFNLFKGGWLGVDIFFVISGYLISNIIISELNSKKFRFTNFYLKRIKRILPALFFTLLVCIPFAQILFHPKALVEFTKSLISSLFFYSNLYFNNLDFYNAAPAKVMPLLHTWSLSIEEQFYILFPMIVYVLFKYLKKYVFPILLILFFLSLFSNLIQFGTEKFYFLQYRFWELLLGCLIMILQKKINLKIPDIIGVIFLLFPIFYFSDDYINQIEPKLISLFGLSILLFNSTHISSVKKFLNTPILQKIGLISYSLYLVHQPVFSFTRYYFYGRFLNLDLKVTLILILFSLILATFMYKYIENGFKKNFQAYSFLITSFLIILLFCFFSLRSNGFEENDNELYSYLEPYYTYQREGIPETECINQYKEVKLKHFCYLKLSTNSTENLMIIGDSHLETLSKYLADTLISKKYNLFVLNQQGCPFIVPKIIGSQAECATEDAYQEFKSITAITNPTIIYGGRFPWYYNGDSFASNLGSTSDDMTPGGEKLLTDLKTNIEVLIDNSKRLLILHPIPELGIFPLEAYRNEFFHITEPLSYKHSFWIDYSQEINQLIDIYENNQVVLIKTGNIFCDSFIKQQCVASFDSIIFYYDDDHLTYDGASLIGKEIVIELEK